MSGIGDENVVVYPKLEFKDVQDFFKSWGLYPYNEDTDPYNKDVIDEGINEPCFNQLMQQAEGKYGLGFAQFCSRMIDATDNAFYLRSETWAQVENCWDNRLPHER